MWVLFSNKLVLSVLHPPLAASRSIPVSWIQAGFSVLVAVVVTLCISSVGLLILNSLLVLPGAAARNVAKNMKQYHILSVLFALVAGIGGLIASYYLGSSTGAAISLLLALLFAVSFCMRKRGA